MIYAYGNVRKDPKKYRYNESDYLLADIMLTYWSNFAKTGDPNGSDVPTWNLYNPSNNKVMELGEHLGDIDDEYLSLYILLDEYIDWELENENTQI